MRNKASLALLCFCKQKYQKGLIHRQLKVPTSERKVLYGNLRVRAVWAPYMEKNLLKFTETRAHFAREL
jgi:hypothetical protein